VCERERGAHRSVSVSKSHAYTHTQWHAHAYTRARKHRHTHTHTQADTSTGTYLWAGVGGWVRTSKAITAADVADGSGASDVNSNSSPRGSCAHLRRMAEVCASSALTSAAALPTACKSEQL
jgi:hypothetical protein